MYTYLAIRINSANTGTKPSAMPTPITEKAVKVTQKELQVRRTVMQMDCSHNLSTLHVYLLREMKGAGPRKKYVIAVINIPLHKTHRALAPWVSRIHSLVLHSHTQSHSLVKEREKER